MYRWRGNDDDDEDNDDDDDDDAGGFIEEYSPEEGKKSMVLAEGSAHKE